MKIWKLMVITLVVGVVLINAGNAFGGSSLFYISSGKVIFHDTEANYVTETIEQNIKFLDIEGPFNIEISNGNSFEFLYDIDSTNFEIVENTLKIYEKSSFGGISRKLVIKIPYELDSIDIDTTVANLDISNLTAKHIKAELDLGNLKFNNVEVEYLDIDLNLGNAEIYNTNINTLKAKLDLGNMEMYNSTIMANSDISCNVGNVELNLFGNIQDYSIRSEKTLGTSKINGENVSSAGSGDINIKVTTDLGSSEINFK